MKSLCCPVSGIITHIGMEIWSDLIMRCCVMVLWMVIVVCIIDHRICIINIWVDGRQHKDSRPSQSKLHILVFLLIAHNKLCWKKYQRFIPSEYADKWEFCFVAYGKLKNEETLHAQKKPQCCGFNSHTHLPECMYTHAANTCSFACMDTHSCKGNWLATERPFSCYRLLMATR